MLNILRWILLPFSLIYILIVYTRNILFDYNIKKSTSFNIPTIVVGNLAIGGTGKTPLTEYLIKLLKDKYKVATLSRGYGRKTKGFRLVNTTDSASLSGDEPLQFKKKFNEITVAVDENRCNGVSVLQHEHDIIILDDAYQHRKLKPGFSILLFDFNTFNHPIIPLPTGNFRDNFSTCKRADIIVLTKCPSTIKEEDKQHIEKKIRKYNNCPIFYTSIAYEKPISLNNNTSLTLLSDIDILLVTGIANPKPLLENLSNQANTVQHVAFPDHHFFVEEDYKMIKNHFDKIHSAKKIIITTEKDSMRLDLNKLHNMPIFYIPIHLIIADNQKLTFDHFIENYIQSVKQP